MSRLYPGSPSTPQVSKDLLLKLVMPHMMRTIRKALGLSQEQVADLVGVSRQSMNYYESASGTYPSVETVLKWAEVVETQIKKLRKDVKDPTGSAPSHTSQNLGTNTRGGNLP